MVFQKPIVRAWKMVQPIAKTNISAVKTPSKIWAGSVARINHTPMAVLSERWTPNGKKKRIK